MLCGPERPSGVRGFQFLLGFPPTNEANRPSAIAQLNAFIRAVEGFISGGLLTAEQGQPLIDAAQSIIDQLST